MLYDPFLRKDFFKDKPWYADFLMFHNIGVCQSQDEYVAEIREALARFLLTTRTFPGKEPGTTFIAGDGFIDIKAEDMAAYIQAIHDDSAGNRPQAEQPPQKDTPEMSCFLDESENAALAEIQARCYAATPGPWETAGKEVIHPTGESWLEFYKRAHRSDGKIANNVGRARKEADAELMAHAREDLPFLLSIISKARQYIEDVK